tara:strand:- start:37 stop:2409 length:2373 start_codon:yes stop_codon:yes gene_type:complete
MNKGKFYKPSEIRETFTLWRPKKPSKLIKKTLVDFEIKKLMTSTKSTNKKGQSLRGFTDIQSCVIFYYYDQRNKLLDHMLKKRANYHLGRNSIPGVKRSQMVDEARRNGDYSFEIKGEPSRVLSESLKKIKGTGLSQLFLHDWEGVTVSNITDHLNHVEKLAVEEISGSTMPFGIYNQQNPNDTLLTKIKLSGQSFETISQHTGVPLTMVYRHTQNKAPIDREYAIRYAKHFGMDPSEILFNDITVPIEGVVSFEKEDTGEVKFLSSTYEFAKCPRDIYRPDIKCVKVDSPNSIYNKCNFFYYQEGEIESIKRRGGRNQLCILTFNFKDQKFKAIGRIERDKYEKISLKNPDPEVYSKTVNDIIDSIISRQTSHKGPDIYKDRNSPISSEEMVMMIYDQEELFCKVGGNPLNDKWFEKNKPVSILPIVATINHELTIKDAKRASIIREEDDWYKKRTLEDAKIYRGQFYGELKANRSTKDEESKKIQEELDRKIQALSEQIRKTETEFKKRTDANLNEIIRNEEAIDELIDNYVEEKTTEVKLREKKSIERQSQNEKPWWETDKGKKLIADAEVQKKKFSANKEISWLIEPDEITEKLDSFLKNDPVKAKEFFSKQSPWEDKTADYPEIKVGVAKGKKRAEKAAEAALAKEVRGINLAKASEVLIVITGSNNVRLVEIDLVVNKLRKEIDPEAEIVFGAIKDDNMEDELRVSIMAVAEGKIKDEILINNAVSNFYFYKEIGVRKSALRMALGSPALNNDHREKVVKIISKKTPEILSYKKAEIYPFRKAV